MEQILLPKGWKAKKKLGITNTDFSSKHNIPEGQIRDCSGSNPALRNIPGGWKVKGEEAQT